MDDDDKIKSAVKEAFAEIAKEGGVPVQLNMANLAKQLLDPTVDHQVRQYFQRTYRLSELLKERARRAARDTYDFIDREMRHVLFNPNQFAVIESRKDQISEVQGSYLDLGVYKGSSTRELGRIFPEQTIHGFDSFEGLPEDWSHATKGSFGDVKGQLPKVPDNCILYKGWFDDTLPEWVKDNNGQPIAMLRVDCDIYSSTKTIFDTVGHLLVPKSFIVFDELIGYYGFQDHEWKAFQEFLEKRPFAYEYIAYGLTYTIVRLNEKLS